MEVKHEGGVWGTKVECEVNGDKVTYAITAAAEPPPAAVALTVIVKGMGPQMVLIPVKDWLRVVEVAGVVIETMEREA